VLDLLRQFIHEVEEEDERGRKTGKRYLIFPRYQQLDAVRKLVAHARATGAGQRYLIQHSAGSGKSFTIAWLAHLLSTLHNISDRRVFDSIVVITDRRILDRQLQATVRQFEQTLGVVENIDHTSRQLKDALESGKTIIVTTLQKFPVIAKEIGELVAVLKGSVAERPQAVLLPPRRTARKRERRDPNADDVQTVEPWTPPEQFEGFSTPDLNKALDRLRAGLGDGRLYSAAPSAKERAAWRVLQDICPAQNEARCRRAITTWVKNGVLTIGEYTDEKLRKKLEGITAAKVVGVEIAP
jgi:hypothetical protein